MRGGARCVRLRFTVPRKPRPAKQIVAFKVEPDLAALLDAMPNKSEFIRAAVQSRLATACPLCRGSGLAPVLASAALKAACDRFALRCFYGVAGARDDIAHRVASRCGFSRHPGEGAVLASPR